MKYNSQLCDIDNCPPKSVKVNEQIAFRFVHEPICEKSFLPQGVKNPKRVHNEPSAKTKCSLLALSFFTSEDKAKKRYNALKKNVSNISKTLGTHIAVGNLKPEHGFQTPVCSKSSHFDFFEKKDTELARSFDISQCVWDKL
jgi:hypothetical protein